MPYIDQNARIEIEAGQPPYTPGELNYVISTQLWRWSKDRNYFTSLEYIIGDYIQSKGHSYTTFNEVMGVLEYVYREFKRRPQTRPDRFNIGIRIRELQDWLCVKYSDSYEDKKLKLNGEVFFSD